MHVCIVGVRHVELPITKAQNLHHSTYDKLDW